MGYTTYNIKVPLSFFHLKDNVIVTITRASFNGIYSNEKLVTLILNEMKVNKRVANSIASRVSSRDLANYHKQIKQLGISDVSSIKYSRDRMYVTILTN